MPTIPYHHATMRNAWYDTPLTDESPWERFLCPPQCHNTMARNDNSHIGNKPQWEYNTLGHNHDRNGAKPHNAEFPHTHTAMDKRKSVG